MTTDLSPYERERLAEIEAAPAAPESTVERVARAIWDEAKATVHFVSYDGTEEDRERQRCARYRCLAQAAIDAMKPQP